MSAETPRFVWLLRHAKTVQSPPPGKTDHERRLSPRGRRDASALGHRLGEKGDHLGLPASLMPTLVLCSTATRTVQTAERVLAEMSEPPPVRLARPLYEASPENVLEQVRQVEAETTSLMVVGHNPTAHELAATLSSPKDKAGRREVERRGFPTCSLAVLEVPIPDWGALTLGSATLVKLFTPPY